jgi:hypothetical protein
MTNNQSLYQRHMNAYQQVVKHMKTSNTRLFDIAVFCWMISTKDFSNHSIVCVAATGTPLGTPLRTPPGRHCKTKSEFKPNEKEKSENNNDTVQKTRVNSNGSSRNSIHPLCV